MVLIGVHGKRGVGKDTFATYLGKHFPLARKVAFADRLKLVSSHLFDVPLGAFYSDSAKEKVIDGLGLSPREIMVGMSKALRPVFGDDLFIAPVRKIMEEAQVRKFGLIVTDVRGEHEADFIRSNGGIIVHIHRTLDLPEIDHWSEQGIRVCDTDLVVQNNGTLGDLQKHAEIISQKCLTS